MGSLLADKIDTARTLLDDAGRSADTLDGLHALGLASQTVESAIRTAVTAAREQGASWAEIGHALGTSRQAVWERFAPRDA